MIYGAGRVSLLPVADAWWRVTSEQGGTGLSAGSSPCLPGGRWAELACGGREFSKSDFYEVSN